MPPFERNGRAARRPVFEVAVPEQPCNFPDWSVRGGGGGGHGSTSTLPLDFDPFVIVTSSRRRLGGSGGTDQKARRLMSVCLNARTHARARRLLSVHALGLRECGRVCASGAPCGSGRLIRTAACAHTNMAFHLASL